MTRTFDPGDDPEGGEGDLLTALISLKRALAAQTVGVDPGVHQVLHQVKTCEPVRQGAIAEQLGLDASTISRHVRALVAAGLVASGRDPDDGRATQLSLTERGTALIAERRAAHRGRLAAATATFTDQERADLVRLLNKLAARLDSLEEHE